MTNETILEPTPKTNKWFRLLVNGWRTSFSGWTVILFSLISLLFIIYQVFQWGDEKQVSLISDALQAVTSLAAVILAWRVTRHPAIDERSKRAWRILTASYFSYSFGHLAWFYLSSILQIEPFPSIADVGFWGYYPLMLWALLTFPTQKTEKSERLKFLMDVGIVVLGGSTAVWNFIIRPTLEVSAEGDLVMTLLNLSYVVGDLVLFLGIATVLLRSSSGLNRIALLTIVAGLFNTSIADIGFAYFTLQGTYTSGHWIDNFFISGILFFILASHLHWQNLNLVEEAEEIEESKVQKFSWLPYLAIAVVFGILLYETRQYWADWLGIIVFCSIGMTVLVVFRQLVAVKENLRLQSEYLSRVNESKFKTLIENSSDMISLRNSDGKIVFRSPSTKNIVGYETEEIEQYNSLELVHPDDVDDFQELFAKLENGVLNTFKKEYRFKHKNGSWLVMEGIANKVDDEESGIHGIIINSRDITKRKQDEEKLRIFMEKLQSSNQELQDFAYVASHDLQEPLRKIQAFGDRLMKKCAESLSDEGQDYIRRMGDAASRMQRLINDLLMFSRVTTKAQPFESVDLKKITNEVISDLEVRIEDTKAEVEIGDLPKIDADPTQIRQLLQNLIGNALKFTKPGENPKIKIDSNEFVEKGVAGENGESKSEQIKMYQITVQDNGIGFDEKYLDRIFTVFQRLHGRTEYEGSGVGLAICRKIVERHRGTITAKSKEGEGATFIIKLPIKQNQEETINNERL